MSFMLSEKGWIKAERYLCPECWGENNWTTSDEPIFEQDDLQGMVVLTVEEAKKILETSYEVLYLSDCETTLTNEATDAQNLLKQRIKLAEGTL